MSDCTNAPGNNEAGGSFISLTEGNLGDSHHVCSAQNALGSIIDFTIFYNSYLADGSQASMNTVMGFGWTHSYNIFLVEQRRQIFKIGPTGRTVKFRRGPGNTYLPTQGHYIKSMIRKLDGSFSLTLKDGIQYNFQKISPAPFFFKSTPWMLTSIIDRNGDTTTLSYNSKGLLEKITAFNREVLLEYTADKKLKSIKDPLNRITTLDYTGYDLTGITDPAGNSVEYTYNIRHQMTGKKNKNGHTFSYEYNSRSKPFCIKDAKGDALFTLSNSENWAIDSAALFRNMERTYKPATTTKIDGRGNTWKYEYNEMGYLTRVIDPSNCETTYSYDGRGNLMSTTDANGRITTYEYDAMGNQTKIIDPLGNKTEYTYTSLYNLVKTITDPDGDVTTYTYDANGNLLSETDPLGNVTAYTYDAHGNILTITDCHGNTTTYEYDSYGNRIKETDPLLCETHFTHDIIGNRLTRTDANGHTTAYEYDPLDRLVKETDPKGCIITYTYDGEGNSLSVTDAKGTTTNEYDLRDRLIKITDAKGGITIYAYDKNDNKISETNALGFTTAYAYDSQNRLTKITDAKGCITTMTYDCAGNKISETDANGHTTTYEYDGLNRLIKTTDALGNITTYTYNGSGGGGCPSCGGPPTAGSSLISSITDCMGNVTCYKYCKLDRLLKVIKKVGDPNCSIIDADDVITEYTYDCVGNRLTETDGNGNSTTYTYNARNELVQECNPEGECTLYTYDCVGNKLSEALPNGNVIAYIYDEKNQLVSMNDSIGQPAIYTYDCVGNRITEKDGNNNTTSYSYDELNRLVKVTDPMGEFTSYEYDAIGNLIKVADRELNQTSYTYDEINRRITITDPIGNVTGHEYDCVGNLTKITDCNGNSTTYVYDQMNRLVKEIYADGGIKEFTYDCVGNLVSRKDQNGIITAYQYDGLYRLITRDYPGTNDDAFTYDKGGRMLTADNLNSAITFSYDGANRTTQTTQNGLVVSYTYDIANNKRIITYPGGKVVKEEMDKRDRLKTIKDSIDQIIAENSYDPGDRIIARTFLNTTHSAWNYNQNNWITQLTHEKGASNFVNFEYSYDKEGNRGYAKKNHDTSNSEKYTYDALYRLTQFKRGTLSGDDIPAPSKDCSWTLDCVGNWLKGPLACPQLGGCSITHNEVNEYTNICGVGQTHDDNGNLTDDGANAYEYDFENRLTKVTRKSDSLVLGEYRYDALSRRVEKVVSMLVTRFIYDDARVIEERQSGVVEAEYVYGSWIDEVLTMDRGGNTYYYHTNALGSIAALTDSVGGIVEHYRYDAYGKPEILVDAGMDGIWFTADDVLGAYSGVGNPYLFTGRRLDKETGLYYYRARYYDSERGRFLQRDPLGYGKNPPPICIMLYPSPCWNKVENEMNLYEYVASNPLLNIDPFGLAQTPLTNAEKTQCKNDRKRALKILRNALLNVSTCASYFNGTKYCSAANVGNRLNSFKIEFANPCICSKYEHGHTYDLDGQWKMWLCPYGCRLGRWNIAATIIHELYHECQPGAPETGAGSAGGAETACGF